VDKLCTKLATARNRVAVGNGYAKKQPATRQELLCRQALADNGRPALANVVPVRHSATVKSGGCGQAGRTNPVFGSNAQFISI
jgi:hypothetical protein